jgi:magnesium transporter
MNFDHMPELHWDFGYPLAVGLMFGAALLMYVIFKRKGWL